MPGWTGQEAGSGQCLQSRGRHRSLVAVLRDQAPDGLLVDAVHNHATGAKLELDLPGRAPQQSR